MVETTESRDAEIERIMTALQPGVAMGEGTYPLACRAYDAGLRSTSRDSEAERKIEQLRGAYREAADWITAVQTHYVLGPEASPDDIFLVASENATSRDSEVREAALEAAILEYLAADADMPEFADAQRMGAEAFDRLRRRWDAADLALRAILDRSSEAAPTPSKDRIAAMSDAEVNAFLESRGLDVCVASEAVPSQPDFRETFGLGDGAAEAAPAPYPRTVAVDENGIPSLVTHYPASEAAPVVGLDASLFPHRGAWRHAAWCSFERGDETMCTCGLDYLRRSLNYEGDEPDARPAARLTQGPGIPNA